MRSRTASAGLLALCLLLVACGGAAAPPTATSQTTASAAATASASPSAQPKSMTVEVWSAFDSFNPVTAQSGYDDTAISLMFDSLDWQSQDNQFHPLLASSWDISPDYKTYTFHIDPKASRSRPTMSRTPCS